MKQPEEVKECDNIINRYRKKDMIVHIKIEPNGRKIHGEDVLRLYSSQQTKWCFVYWVHRKLDQRVYEHKNAFVPSFTKKYAVHQLVYYEVHQDIQEALFREKQMKKWNRAWKVRLIHDQNPDWIDLYPSLLG